jgi:putative motility protein YjfB-like
MADITRMSGIPPTASSDLAQAQLAQEVGIRIAAKTLDAARAQGDAAISLLQAAASFQEQSLGSIEPHMGQSLDVRA